MKGSIPLTVSFLLVACLTQVYGGYNKGYDDAKGRLADCERDLKKCQHQLYNSDSKKLEYEIIALSAAKGRLTNEAKDLDCKLKECTIGNTVLTDKVVEITAEKNRVNGQITRLQDKIKELECKLKSPGADCEKEKQELLKQKAALKEKIGVLSESVSGLEPQLADCIKDNDTCTANLLNITSLNEQCAKELKAITDSDGKCEGLVTMLRQQIADLPLSIAECNDWLANNVTALKNCEDILKGKTDDLNKCNNDLIACQEKSKELNDALNACKENLGNFKSKYEECSPLLEACKKEKKDCKDKLDSSIQKCSELAAGLSVSFLSTGAYYFQLIAGVKTWYEAKDFCGLHGWKLLKLDDANENNVISAEIIKLYGTTDKVFWIALNELNFEGTWTNFGWDNGAPFISWKLGEPDNNGGVDEDCATIKLDNSIAASLDYPCLDKSVHGFICEIPKPCADLLKKI